MMVVSRDFQPFAGLRGYEACFLLFWEDVLIFNSGKDDVSHFFGGVAMVSYG